LDTAGFALHGVDVRARRVVVAEGEYVILKVPISI
jgi:hypothetical protein